MRISERAWKGKKFAVEMSGKPCEPLPCLFNFRNSRKWEFVKKRIIGKSKMNKKLEEVLKDIEKTYTLKQKQNEIIQKKLNKILQDLNNIEKKRKQTK